ncbi:MAG: S8 family peptidase [Pseudomonadota bacterium]
MTGKVRAAQAATVAGFITLTACGGGGGSVGTIPTPIESAPTPTPTASPSPSPSAPPTGTNYDTTEYRATVGNVSMNALAAYNRSATGLGINVAVIDTGLDQQSAEFGGRVSAASTNVAGGTTYDDEGGHGTAVSFTIAGRRNGAGTHGVAFDATIVALRADTPGTCAADDPDDDDDGCTFRDSSIARGIDAATAAGARVINMSLGSNDAFGNNVLAAIGRATAAGIVIVLSAGNGFDENPTLGANPEATAQVANNDAVSRGLVIISGSVGPSDGISSFSNRAGNSAAHYLAAVGERVRAPDQNGTSFLWSGTSFSAPQIAGAVALLAQAFPNLSGSQIVQLLYTSARDAGAAGDDGIYGQGVLDLTRAFQPIGSASLANGKEPISFSDNATLSAPMGDAAQNGLGAVILDGFDRAFAIDLAKTINRSGPQRRLSGLIGTRTRTTISRAKDLTVAVTIAPGRDRTVVERTLLGVDQAEGARALAGSVIRRLGSDASFALGFATGGGALTAQLAGRDEPAFLVARAAGSGFGFDSDSGSAAALRIERFGFGLTAAAESGRVLWRQRSDLAALDGRYRGSSYDRFSLAADRRFGLLSTSLSLTRLGERATVLGAHFGAGLGSGSATSWLADVGARLDAGAGWSVGGTYRQGWTNARLSGAAAGTGTILTRAFAADVGKDGVFGTRDTMGLRIAQPLRVARGGIDVRLPTYYDYATLAPSEWTVQRLNLAPSGRELDYEWRYATPFGAGTLAGNLFWRRDPGNFASLPDDKGAAVRYAVAF